ncbi:MAG: sulfatase-like hydrolase/transferase [Verrucomicrobia bacterium]|nr:sulfatase-like hydrolase/transferase [Verrucomicrobiota bacterium]
MFLFAAVAGAALSDAAPKPNIVVILSDDAGYNEFSLNGSKTIQTPRIDSIARSGVRFTNGYVSGTVCSPSRAGLLTGRYQQRFGHEFNIPPAYSETNGLPLSETLLPAVLKPAGYRTIALGKWHLGYAPKFHPMERGFTDYYGFLQGSRSYFPLPNPTRLNRLLLDREPVAKEEFDYMTDHLAAKTSEYITKHKAEPFFIYLAFNATHGPSHATKADLEKAGGNRIKAMTLALDRAVGTVLDSLKQNGIIENTLVFFINDNGGATGHNNAPLRGHKGQTWEGGIRIPFAVQWPAAIPAGKTSDSPVIALDIFPTAMAAAGIEKSPGKPLDGVNLLPYLTGRSGSLPNRPLFWKSGSAWAIRDGDMILVGGNTDQKNTQPALFDLAKDISESSDLAATRPEEVKRLQAIYQTWAATHQPTPWRGRGQNDESDEGDGENPPAKKPAAKRKAKQDA